MPPSSEPPLLCGEHITRTFGDGERRLLVLNDVSLTVEDGELVAILGPSGSGKSTLLRILAGLNPASAGSVRFRGQIQTGCNPHIAIVFQSFALFPWLTVYQNVEIGLLNAPDPEPERRRRVLEAIDTIGLDGFESAFPKELSGGMRQRVGFARAIVIQPEILFMDEPFSALDVLTAENLRRELLSLWRSRAITTRAIVMVTHSIEEAVGMGDRIVVMGHNPGVVRVNMAGLPVDERPKDHPEHVRLVDYLYGVMTNPEEATRPFRPGELAAGAVSAPQPYQMLPHVAVGEITGLVERLHRQGDRVDVYQLARDLRLTADTILPLVQAVDLLGMGDAVDGDVFLTPTGIRFAEAGVQEEKDVFRECVSDSVQLIHHIMAALDTAPNHRVKREVIREDIEPSFGRDEAERQLDTAVAWGRYAELFGYDTHEAVFYLDP